MKKYKRARQQNVAMPITLRSGLQALRQDFDILEFITGVFVASMCLLRNDAFPWLFAQARDTVLSGIAFEALGMPILGLSRCNVRPSWSGIRASTATSSVA